MAVAVQLQGVRCPFKAVAEYPPTLPYVGQDSSYHRLADFADSVRREDEAHFFAIFGDWAIGKSRLAHELVAQFCGESKGWILSDGRAAPPLLQPLSAGGTVIPLFVSFVDALNFEQFGLDAGTAMGKLTCAAVAYLSDERRVRGSHRSLLQALRKALTDLDPNFDFDHLLSLASDTSRGFPERAHELTQKLVAMTGNLASRVLIIVDEVESGGEVNPFADEIEREVNTRPIPLRAVRDLYSGVKDATNTGAYPRLNFLFFNTLVSRRMAGMEALERRMITDELGKASAADLDQLTMALRQTGYPLRSTLEDLARRAFFAADRNFGWFSFIMNKAHYILVQQPDLEIGDVFAQVCERTGRVFQPQVFEDRDIQPPDVKDAMRRVIYNQVPATPQELGFSPALRPNLLSYQDPFQTRFVGEAAVVELTADQLTNDLLSTNNYVSDQKPRLTGEGSVNFDPAELLGSLRTFAWGRDGSMDVSERLWIYVDPANFEGQVSFAYTGFGSNLSAATVRTIHGILLARHRIAHEGELIVPTMALLRRFNDLWGKAAASNWLPEATWEQVITTIDKSPDQNDQRLLQGLANTLFDHPQPITPSPYPDLSGLSLTIKLESHETYNVTPRNQLVFLRARETPQGIADDLRTIRQRVPVFLIFLRAADRDAWQRYVRETHQEHLTTAVIPHVVEPQTREWEFYIRYALREQNNGFKAQEVSSKGKELRGEFQDVLRDEFGRWLAKSEQDGYVLRPFYPARTNNTPAFRQFAQAYAGLLRAGDAAALNQQPGQAAVLSGLEDYERERQGDTLLLIEGEGAQRRAVVPPIMPRILDVLRTHPLKLPELESDLFYARSRRTVNFPTTGSGVLEQLMALLQEIGAVELDSQARYTSRSVSAIGHKFDLAFQRLGSFDEPKSGYAQQVSSLSAPVRALAHRLAVNEDQLLLLKNQELVPAREQLQQLPLERLTALPPDQRAFEQVTQSIGRIAAALDKVLGQPGQPTQPPAIDPRTLQDRVNEISGDAGYQQYSIEYRVTFLKLLEDYLAERERELHDTLAQRNTSVEQQYAINQGGSPFPIQPMVGLLQAIECDLGNALEGNVLPPQLRQHPNDAPLRVLKGAGRLSDVLLKLDWYRRQLDTDNQEDWWVQYTSAYQTWQSVLTSYQGVEQAWDQLDRYFAGTSSEHKVKFTGPELGPDVQELREFVQNFGASLDQQHNVTLADLAREVGGVRERCTSAQQRIIAARTNAEDEISSQLDDTENRAVLHLAERLHQQSILPNRQKVLDARTHVEAHAASDRYREAIGKLGITLCGERRELYDRYVQLYRDSAAGMESDQLIQKYGEPVLRELSERKLVTLKTVVDI